MDEPYLSLIIPARNEANRLPRTLEQAERFLDVQGYSSEIIVVENGSTDGTAGIARRIASGSGRVRLIELDLPGKGRAVRAGMLAARGAYRLMADADLSMPVEEISRFLPQEAGDFDIVIGSREAPGAVRYDEPQYRHFGGRLVNWMIRVLALPGLQDTQCGYKLFTAAAAESLFNVQTLTGWSFDIEILYAARLRGCSILELPIQWYFRPESKVRPVRDALQMLADILRIRRNARQGHYSG